MMKEQTQFSAIVVAGIIALAIVISLFTILAIEIAEHDKKVHGVTTITIKTTNERELSILSSKMDRVVSACYYDLYQNNDTERTTQSGNSCNLAMEFFKENCKVQPILDACSSQYFQKYLQGAGM